MLRTLFSISILLLCTPARLAHASDSANLLPLVPIEFTVANEFDLRWDSSGSRILRAGKEVSDDERASPGYQDARIYHTALRDVLGEHAAETMLDETRVTLTHTVARQNEIRSVSLYLFATEKRRLQEVAELARSYQPLLLLKNQFGFKLVYEKNGASVGSFSQHSLRKLNASIEYAERYGFLYQGQDSNGYFFRLLFWALTGLALYAALRATAHETTEEEEERSL